MGAESRRFNNLLIACPYSIGVVCELDGRAPPGLRKLWQVIPPRPTLKIEKLSDNFGQFVITLRCECGHARNASPKTFAGIAGWDAKLTDVVKRARCSKCGKRGRCTVNVRHEHKRDG
jgi:hypothetical protein